MYIYMFILRTCIRIISRIYITYNRGDDGG